jgi:uncharacterized protein YndB with AHSA1/START domain
MSYDVKLERVLEATPEQAFDAYTDPDVLKGTFADDPSWIQEWELDFREGGEWRVVWTPPGGEPLREKRVFQVIDRPRRLVFSMSVELPDGSTLDLEIDITFEEENGKTRMKILNTGFPTEEIRDSAEKEGWPGPLDKFEEIVKQRVGRS